MDNDEQVNGVRYWRGTVDSRLKNLENGVAGNGEKLDELYELVKNMEKNEGKFVAWDYIRDKITVPIIVAVLVVGINLLFRI